MSWSENAWKSIEPILAEIKGHPFVKELASGTLPTEKFARYLGQDRIYLANYGKEMRDLAAMLPDSPLPELYRKFAQESIDSENELHYKLEALGYRSIDTEPLAGTAEYMRHTSEIIAGGDLALSMAAMLPCMWVYNEVGKYILGIARLDGNPYRSWIECYTSPMMEDGTRCSVELTDRLADKENAERRKAMTRAFVKSTMFEYTFWDQAYKAPCSPGEGF